MTTCAGFSSLIKPTQTYYCYAQALHQCQSACVESTRQASSPVHQSQKHKKTQGTKPRIVLNVNCQSVKSKKERRLNLIDCVKPDFKVGT